jgi:hypothetical protein
MQESKEERKKNKRKPAAVVGTYEDSQRWQFVNRFERE